MLKVPASTCQKLLVAALAAALLLGPSPSAASPASPRVAVLVHGYLGFDVLGKGSTCTPRATLFAPGTPNEWGKVADTLRAAGWRVYFAHWRTGPAGSSTIAEAAGCLAAQVAQLKLDENAGRVTLITHSMGGLVARAYFEGPAARGDVERLITFGAPHLGVNFERFLKLASLFKVLDATFDRTATELSFEGMRAFNTAHPRHPQTRYSLVGGTREGWSSFIINPDGRLPNDGLMYTASALGLRDSGVGRFSVDDVHADLLRKPFDQSREYVYSENSLNCLRSFLTLAGARACRPASTLAIAEALGDSSSTAFGPTLQGDLAPGESRTLPVVLGGDATVFVSWRGAADAKLRSPDGAFFAPTERTSLPFSDPANDSDVQPDQTLAVFTLPQAAAGTWQLHVAAGQSGPARFAAFGTFTSPTRLRLEVPSSISPSSLFSLTAALTTADQPLDGATVTADLITGDTRRLVRLTPLGDGVYASTLPAPAGPATLRVLATGRTPDGLPFIDEKSLPIFISPSQSPRAFLPLTTR